MAFSAWRNLLSSKFKVVPSHPGGRLITCQLGIRRGNCTILITSVAVVLVRSMKVCKEAKLVEFFTWQSRSFVSVVMFFLDSVERRQTG